MKKTYETPTIEKVDFQYKEQVVASNGNCQSVWVNIGVDHCSEGNKHQAYLN